MSLTPQDISTILEIESRGLNLKDNLDLLLPEEVTLSYLSGLCLTERGTVYKHLLTNYIEDENYHQKIKGGTIYVARAAALEMRRHYVK